MLMHKIIILLFIVHAALAELTVQECRELGFIKAELVCARCEKLDDYGLEILKQQCKECCIQGDATGSDTRYAKAVLEVCTCKFRAYPQIQAFVKSERPAKYPNLQIKYVRGLDPIVKMLDAAGNVKETLSISKWNTDAVDEFFDTHLEKNNIK